MNLPPMLFTGMRWDGQQPSVLAWQVPSVPLRMHVKRPP
eukprot:CAMPEP_0183827014 /NCGR_PEP_ID=MMETSP0807_2-20130328/2012_1 /TAXON_ID=88271 /ORGANISM="Picocystis salinarum, Strain CCMP1897" /LENGTH=38 /DNA_ID= /DNA_START= /DNA_END= /DNA_ORIENTATION=